MKKNDNRSPGYILVFSGIALILLSIIVSCASLSGMMSSTGGSGASILVTGLPPDSGGYLVGILLIPAILFITGLILAGSGHNYLENHPRPMTAGEQALAQAFSEMTDVQKEHMEKVLLKQQAEKIQRTRNVWHLDDLD